MTRDNEYLRECIKINQRFSKVCYQIDSLLKIYSSNIKQKFMLVYDKILIPQNSRRDTKFIRFKSSCDSFMFSFMDFSNDIYISNLKKIYEVYFPLWKVINYRSKLELEFVN